MIVNFFTTISFIAAVFSLLIAMLVYTKNHKSQLSKVFILLCVSMAYWAFLNFQMRSADTYALASWWDKFNVFWPFSLVLLFHFSLIFTKQRWLLDKKFTVVLLYIPALFFSLIDLFTDQITGNPVLEYWGWDSTVSAPETLVNNLKYLWILMMGLTGLYLVVRFYLKQDDPIEKKQSGFVAIGICIPFVLGVIGEILLPTLGYKLPTLTDVAFAFGTGGFIGYAIWRYELFALTPADAADKIIATMSDCLLLVGPQGNIITANQTSLNLLGYQKRELIGRPVEMVFAEGKPNGALHEKEGADTPNETFLDVESSLKTIDKKRIPVSLSSSILRDKFGRSLGSILIARDITDRKLAEKNIYIQSEKLKSANDKLQALYTFSSVISQTLDVQELIDRALTTIFDMEIFNLQSRGGVLLADGDRLHLVAHLGHEDAFLKSHQDISFDDCLCGLAARTGQMIVSDDTLTDSLLTKKYPERENHPNVIVPLKIAERVVGVMYLYLPAGAGTDESARHLLTTMGNQLAISVENARLYEETKMLSLHDPLTGLANRNLMNIELDKEFARAKRTGRPVSLIMLDLDHFKNFNDKFGHTTGDNLLVDIASIISREIREVDLGCRYGGEEFLLILPDTDTEQAKQIAERIRKATESATFLHTTGFLQTHITVSLGIATYNSTIVNADMLVSIADAALYSAKRKGRNKVEIYHKNGSCKISE